MQIYQKTFRCSENFPAEVDQEWNVRERNKVVENWRVTKRGKASFTVVVKEFEPS